MHALGTRKGVEERKLLLGRRDHVALRHDHEHRRRRHVLHDAMRLPHDDLVVALQRRAVLVPRRPARLGIHHVVKLLLVRAEAHAGRVLAVGRQHGEIDGRVAGGAALAVLHALGEDLGEFLRRELEVEEGADGDAAGGALVEGRGAQGDGAGEGLAPEGDGGRVDDGERAQEGEGVGVVGCLEHGVDVVARFAVGLAERAGVVDEGGDVGLLHGFGDVGDEHFFDAVELGVWSDWCVFGTDLMRSE